MEMYIEIDSTTVNEREIASDRGSFTVRDQIGWLKLPDKRYPQEIVLSLEQGQVPFVEGTYRILESSVTVDKYKHVAFQRSLQLERLKKGET